MEAYSTVKEAITDLKMGKMVLILDDPLRENQADIVFPADLVTPEKANFLIKETRGLFCVAISKKTAAKLDLPLMVSSSKNTEKLQCKFTVSTDAVEVKSFGISASDRATTVKVLANPHAHAGELTRPGHVFPIIAAEGGLHERQGHTEATTELVRLAGFSPTAVFSEVLQENGVVAKDESLYEFSLKHSLRIVTIKDIVNYIS